MPSSHDVATRLGAMTHDELEALFIARPHQLGRQHDLYDCADTLLSADAITATLKTLSRNTLSSLRSGSADSVSRSLVLADENGITYPEVAAVVPAILDQPMPDPPADSHDDPSVIMQSVVAVRDLVDWVLREPLPMGASGTVLKAEERLLSVGLVLPEGDVATLVHLAESAGLVNTIDRRLCATSRGVARRDDLEGIRGDLVEAAHREVGPSLADAMSVANRSDEDFLLWAVPLRAESETQLLRRVGHAHRLVGTRRDTLVDMPPLESRVYVLDDLSIIAPGPLTAATTDFLDTVSIAETRGVASRRRLDPALVLRTVSGGIPIDEVILRLAEMSITPLSPAVTSTITDVATNGRFVTLNGTGTDTAAKASHSELGEMLLTDPRLQRLAPVKVDDVTVLYGASRVRVETALVESRYTVVSSAPERVVVDPAPQHRLIDFVDRLHQTGLGSSHLERALVTAGRSRSRVTLLVETGQGTRTITLEPRHVANGRVRGLDTVADVERTLPISAIVELLAVGK